MRSAVVGKDAINVIKAESDEQRLRRSYVASAEGMVHNSVSRYNRVGFKSVKDATPALSSLLILEDKPSIPHARGAKGEAVPRCTCPLMA